MADQFLVYPYRMKYSTNYAGDDRLAEYQSQVKDGGRQNGSIPISNAVHRGNYQQNTNNHNWWGESFADDNINYAESNQ